MQEFYKKSLLAFLVLMAASLLVAPLGYATPMWLGCVLLGILFVTMKWRMA